MELISDRLGRTAVLIRLYNPGALVWRKDWNLVREIQLRASAQWLEPCCYINV
jgi:hypothetical protein